MILLMFSSKGICQKNTNHCFDSIEIKKLSYIIFERDYLKVINEELLAKDNLLSKERDRLLHGLSLADSINNKYNSIIENKNKEIKFFKDEVILKENQIKKERRVGLGIIILITIITIIK